MMIWVRTLCPLTAFPSSAVGFVHLGLLIAILSNYETISSLKRLYGTSANWLMAADYFSVVFKAVACRIAIHSWFSPYSWEHCLGNYHSRVLPVEPLVSLSQRAACPLLIFPAIWPRFLPVVLFQADFWLALFSQPCTFSLRPECKSAAHHCFFLETEEQYQQLLESDLCRA